MTDRERAHGGTDADHTDRDPVRFGAATPAAEWVMATVGALIAVAIVAALLFYAATDTGDPPDFRTEIVQVLRVGDTHTARVEVSNVGGAPAADVEIVGRLRGQVTEQAHARLDHLSAGATEQVGLVFRKDPDQGDLTVSVVGYRLP